MTTLRELMIERILFAFTEEELQEKYNITEDEMNNLSDLDFLEMYDETVCDWP